MALLQGLLAALFRFLGKILNTAIGWATIMLFGKVSQRRQSYLSLAAFGSVVWLIALLGVAFPGLGLWLLSFMRLPEGVNPGWVRLGMLAGIAVLPLLVGFVLLGLFGRGRRARRGGLGRTLLRGYPYTLGLAATMVIMSVFAPVAKLRHLARRWATMHVPIIIEDIHYREVVEDVQEALAAGGIETVMSRAAWVLRASMKILTVLGGKGHSVVADELTVLRAPGAEILVHPADLVIGAPADDAARIRAILATQLTYTKAYLTYSKDANEMEDEIRTLWEGIHEGAVRPDDLGILQGIEDRLATLPLDFEEWEILHRQVLLLDREINAALRVPLGNGRRDPVVRQALSALGRTLLRAAARTVRTMLGDGKEGVAMKRVSAVFERQNDADRAINWLREQGVPDEKIVAVTKDRKAEETPTDREPPGETVVEAKLDGTSLSEEQIEDGLRRLNGKIQQG